MRGLKFYDEGHIYEYRGERIPSVSEILRFMSREVYGDIDKYVLDNAAQRGTAVHSATEALDRSGTVECSEDIYGYIQAYARFLNEHTVEWKYIETPIAHRRMKYAGTIDRAGIVDGRFAIVDLKTNAAIKKPLVKAQLNGYRKLLTERRERIESLYCLQLLPDGRYRLYPTAINDTEFMACYKMHIAMQKKQKRGKIE